MRLKQRSLPLDPPPVTAVSLTPDNDVRRPVRRRRASALAHRAAPDGARHKLTSKEKRFIEAVCRLWSKHHGWGGKWPTNRRYDVILIGQWVRKLDAPMVFWRRVIRAVPVGAGFVWLTDQPQKDRVGRLEEWWVNERERLYNERKRAESPSAHGSLMRPVGEILREVSGG